MLRIVGEVLNNWWDWAVQHLHILWTSIYVYGICLSTLWLKPSDNRNSVRSKKNFSPSASLADGSLSSRRKLVDRLYLILLSYYCKCHNRFVILWELSANTRHIRALKHVTMTRILTICKYKFCWLRSFPQFLLKSLIFSEEQLALSELLTVKPDWRIN